MLHRKKSTTPLMILIIVYFVFMAIFAYILLFSAEIRIIDEKDASGARVFYIENSTDLQLEDVTVKYRTGNGEAKDLGRFSTLQPKERKLLNFEGIAPGEVTIIAELPLQKTFQRTVVIERKPPFTFRMNPAGKLEAGKEFTLAAEICNATESEMNMMVQETHQYGFFREEPNMDDNEAISAGNCATVRYSLTPLQKGETTIYFNVTGANTTEQYAEPLKVE
ncbi:MAG: hypothetical protein HY544_03110 [Candidatus Diapherotrites archaeon]|uniref:Uncharacterized protein n=1 Tax=Candidatus Iainarchaeum sp. TaxID=3101447 RepID=A0A8T3YLF2_9ARCH|nr:hypothetical protein [Candidatus Diapherotrites archaeon]